RMATKYRCKIILPLPKNIFGYRTDTKDKFNPVAGNPIGEAIKDLTDPRLATITCLEFYPGKMTPFVDNYYASHKLRPTANEVNAALLAAQDICGNKFDLKIQALTSIPPAPPKDPPGSFPN